MYIVVRSPWSQLPPGTEIVPTEPREGHDGDWFKRADGEILFKYEPSEADGKFRLFSYEYTTEKAS